MNGYFYHILQKTTPIEWITGSGYLLCSLFCIAYIVRASNFTDSGSVTRYRVFWSILGLLIITVFASRIFGLTEKAVNFIRISAVIHGWYEERYTFQMFFIGAVFGAVLLIIKYLESSIIDFMKDHRMTLVSSVILASFILIGSASFHPVDQVLNLTFNNCSINNICELLCVILLLFSFIIDFSRRPGTMSNVQSNRVSRYI